MDPNGVIYIRLPLQPSAFWRITLRTTTIQLRHTNGISTLAHLRSNQELRQQLSASSSIRSGTTMPHGVTMLPSKILQNFTGKLAQLPLWTSSNLSRRCSNYHESPREFRAPVHQVRQRTSQRSQWQPLPAYNNLIPKRDICSQNLHVLPLVPPRVNRRTAVLNLLRDCRIHAHHLRPALTQLTALMPRRRTGRRRSRQSRTTDVRTRPRCPPSRGTLGLTVL